MPSQPVYNAIVALPIQGHEIRIGILTLGDQLATLDYLPSNTPLKSANDPTARLVAEQLSAYCRNGRFQFQLPLRIQGTAFQQKVWQALPTIPPSETRYYGHLANRLGGSARAVGNACRANPIPIVIPCHRVVAKQGIGGYCGVTDGQQLRIKQWLLEHERD